jgi:hypothetical protein
MQHSAISYQLGQKPKIAKRTPQSVAISSRVSGKKDMPNEMPRGSDVPASYMGRPGLSRLERPSPAPGAINCATTAGDGEDPQRRLLGRRALLCPSPQPSFDPAQDAPPRGRGSYGEPFETLRAALREPQGERTAKGSSMWRPSMVWPAWRSALRRLAQPASRALRPDSGQAPAMLRES